MAPAYGNGDICGIWENDPPEKEDNCLHLQFVLMDRLESLLTRNRFGKVSLGREALTREAEVLKHLLMFAPLFFGAPFSFFIILVFR